jgi:hypothetical protein
MRRAVPNSVPEPAVTRRCAACCLALAALAAPAAAQKDVGDPLEHFLGTRAADGAKRTLESPVLRLVEDFNNDGLIDVGLWQPRDFGAQSGPVFLYIQRKDGRFAAAGTVVAASGTLLRVAPDGTGSARVLVCIARGPGAPVPSGYEVSGSIVTALPRERLSDACAGSGGAPGAERLDAERFLQNGTQAWIRR